MATIQGIIVDAEFLAKISGTAMQNLIGIGDGRGCVNCGGTGRIVHTKILSSEGEEPPITGNGQAAVLGKGGWYVGESETTPCPLCSGNKDELVNLLLRSSGVPMDHRAKQLGFIEARAGKETLHQTCNEIVESLPNPKGLYTFYGDHGTGKSTAAMILVVEACRSGVRAQYTTANEIAVMVKDTWSNPEKTERDVIEELMKNSLLVIDEVDRVKSFDETGISALIDSRYMVRGEAATILITNMNVAGRGGDSYLKSRMADGTIVRVTGGDMRDE